MMSIGSIGFIYLVWVPGSCNCQASCKFFFSSQGCGFFGSMCTCFKSCSHLISLVIMERNIRCICLVPHFDTRASVWLKRESWHWMSWPCYLMVSCFYNFPPNYPNKCWRVLGGLHWFPDDSIVKPRLNTKLLRLTICVLECCWLYLLLSLWSLLMVIRGEGSDTATSAHSYDMYTYVARSC